MNIFNPRYLNYKEQVQKNKKDIEVLQRIIKDTYHTDLSLETSTTTIAVNDTDIPSTAYTGFLTDANGLFYNIITIKDGIAYLKYWFQLKGEQGIAGPVGPANTLSIGSVTKGDDASATITGEAPNQTLNLVLPKGDQGPQGNPGPKGDQGSTGPANTLSIGSVVKGDNASASITGEAPNQTLNLVLPKGDQGAKGDKGEAGQGYNDLGLWVQGGAYNPYDIVTYNGSSYNCTVAINPSNTPPSADTAHFELFAKGGDQGPKGDQGEQGIQGIPGPIGPSGQINFSDILNSNTTPVSEGQCNSGLTANMGLTEIRLPFTTTVNGGEYYGIRIYDGNYTLKPTYYTIMQVVSSELKTLKPVFNANTIIATNLDNVDKPIIIHSISIHDNYSYLQIEYNSDTNFPNVKYEIVKYNPKKEVKQYNFNLDIITNSENKYENNSRTTGMFNSTNFPFHFTDNIDSTLFDSLESIGLNIGESCLVLLGYKSVGHSDYNQLYSCILTKLSGTLTTSGIPYDPCYVITMFPNCHPWYNNLEVFGGALYIGITKNALEIFSNKKADLKILSYYK